MTGKKTPEMAHAQTHPHLSTSPHDGGVADRYQLLLELSPDAIAVHQEGVVVWVNAAALQFARVTRYDEMVGKPITDYVHPDSLPAMLDRLVAMGDQQGATSGPDDVVMRDSRGAPRHMQVTSVRTTWDGAPAYQVILRDITPLRRQAALIDHVSDAVISISQDGVILTWNPAAEMLYGIASERAIGRTPQSLSIIGDSHSPLDILGVGGTIDAIHRRGDTGDTLAVRQSVTQLDDGYLIVVQPLQTPLVRRLSTVLASLHQPVLLLHNSPHADGDGARIALANPAAVEMIGLDTRAIPGVPLTSLGLEFPQGTSPIDRCLQDGVAFTDVLVHAPRAPGGSRWFSCSGRRVEGDEATGIVLVSVLDVTDHQREVHDLTWQASHDHLTGVLNRAGLITQINNALAAIALDEQIAAYYLDLDGFKAVNDSRGHMVGDEILRIVSRRLHNAISDASIIGRIGGDEFVICARLDGDDNRGKSDPVTALLDVIQDVVSEPIELYNKVERVSTSIGVATARGIDQTNAEALLTDADMALYEARNAARHYAFYASDEDHTSIVSETRQRSSPRAATSFETIPLRYQPIVRPEGGEPVALEAIAVEHADRANGETVRVHITGSSVFHAAAADFASDRWPPAANLEITVSRGELMHDGYLGHLDHAITSQIDPARLRISIPEAMLMAAGAPLLDVLREIRARGIGVALDSFGVGMSSLAAIHRLPITAIKIDGLFVRDLHTDHYAQRIVAHTVDMAHDLGLTTTAKGVVRQEQATILTDLGCDLAQGPYFGGAQPLT